MSELNEEYFRSRFEVWFSEYWSHCDYNLEKVHRLRIGKSYADTFLGSQWIAYRAGSTRMNGLEKASETTA